ncbi:MAG: hypothetical protein L3J43_01760 [Sulfurovum sp.]|nr:hypothetical protein [Sulfurovum sp.]
MRQEINWTTLWLLITTSMGLLSLTYVLLSNEINQYGSDIVSIYLLSSILPFIISKYMQMNMVQKHSMFMHQVDNFV